MSEKYIAGEGGPIGPVEHGGRLSYEIEKTRARLEELTAEYEALPREARIELGCEGVTLYHGARGTVVRMMHGAESPENAKILRMKDQRLAALSEEDREIAINRANDWLDDNFSE